MQFYQCLFGGISAAVASSAMAAHVPAVTTQLGMVNGEGVWVDMAQLNTNEMGTLIPNEKNTGGIWTMAQPVVGNNWMVNIIEVSFDADPFISVGLSLTNTGSSVANFRLVNSLASSVNIPNPVITGTADIDLADISNNGTNASLTTSTSSGARSSMYTAFIDSTDVRSLLALSDPNVPLSAPFPLSDNASDFYIDELAIEPLNVNDAFGLVHEFRLSPGDRITINSTFFIIPEPSGALLLVTAGLAGVLRRRR